jgi:hypothetical protein
MAFFVGANPNCYPMLFMGLAEMPVAAAAAAASDLKTPADAVHHGHPTAATLFWCSGDGLFSIRGLCKIISFSSCSLTQPPCSVLLIIWGSYMGFLYGVLTIWGSYMGFSLYGVYKGGVSEVAVQ